MKPCLVVPPGVLGQKITLEEDGISHPVPLELVYAPLKRGHFGSQGNVDLIPAQPARRQVRRTDDERVVPLPFSNRQHLR